MDVKSIADRTLKRLSAIEDDLNRQDCEKMLQWDAVKSALRHGDFISRIRLLMDILQKKLGIIPSYSADKFRKDEELRKNIQMLRNDLILLKCSQKEEADVVVVGHRPVYNKQKIVENLSYEKLSRGYIALIVERLDKGGVEQVVAILASGFKEKNLRVRVLCLRNGGMVAEKLKEEGIEVLEFYNDTHKFKQYIRRDPPIIANTHFVKRHVKFLYRQGIPVIEDIHNMYVYFSRRMKNTEKKNEKYYTKLVAVSEMVKETYKKEIMNSDKIEVIGNAATLPKQTCKSRGEVRRTLNIPAEAYVLLNVGSIDKRKNQIGIVQAFNIVTQIADIPIYLVFAGNIQDDVYREKLQEEIDRCPNNNVILLSYYEKVSELYRMADVFVLDSYYEGWSIAATEALYEGLPVIHSMCGSARELTHGGEYGITISNPAGRGNKMNSERMIRSIQRYENENMQELVEALLQMIYYRKEWEEKRTFIKSEARNLFAIEKMVDSYLLLFENSIA